MIGSPLNATLFFLHPLSTKFSYSCRTCATLHHHNYPFSQDAVFIFFASLHVLLAVSCCLMLMSMGLTLSPFCFMRLFSAHFTSRLSTCFAFSTFSLAGSQLFHHPVLFRLQMALLTMLLALMLLVACSSWSPPSHTSCSRVAHMLPTLSHKSLTSRLLVGLSGP